jgi:hypothetical protein
MAPYRIVGGLNLPLHFHPDHLADLRASGLADDTIRGARVYSLRPKDFTLFFNARRGAPEEIRSALCFPYARGAFARIKLFPALQKMKYAQPSRTSARLYMPFSIGAGAVYVCEGEKKTLAAHQAGLNAVGIGGVWNWLSAGQPIDDLAAVEWEGQDVMIIPDSDVFPRVDLLRAIYALGCELRTLGASVLVARIPQENSKKVGLDDYLATGGNVHELEVFALSHSIFKSAAWWHGKWKFKNVLKAAQKKSPGANPGSIGKEMTTMPSP